MYFFQENKVYTASFPNRKTFCHILNLQLYNFYIEVPI